MAEEVIVKVSLNKILYALLGREELVERWWYTPNRGFGDCTPDEVYQTGPEGRKKVKDYLCFYSDQNS